MKILFVSTLVSEKMLDFLYKTSSSKMLYSIQKFHRLLLCGFVMNQVNVRALSAIPVTSSHRRKWWKAGKEQECGVAYRYVPFVNLVGIRQVCLFIGSFLYTLAWCRKNGTGKRVVCDVLNISVCAGALLASKLMGIKSVGIVTDMPGLMVSMTSKKSLYLAFVAWVNKSYLKSFDYYVFLTEQMNPKINIRRRPYIVMEGLVDANMKNLPNRKKVGVPRNVIYAGGLHEEYGVKMLLEAFILLDMEDVTLSLYGDGPLVPFIKECENRDKRIHYYGVQPNEKIVEEELKATLLVNPRFTHEEFTQYSFPSKNMEYMVSGTPVLTTKLPGMPEEYYPYVFLFEEESVEGYYWKLKEVLSLPLSELKSKGKAGKDFVLKHKNNVIQARRVLELLRLA